MLSGLGESSFGDDSSVVRVRLDSKRWAEDLIVPFLGVFCIFKRLEAPEEI